MLFLLNRPEMGAMANVGILAPGGERELLLINDGAYLARAAGLAALAAHGFEEIYVEAQAVAERGLEPADGCEVVTMEEVVDIMLDAGKVINL